MASVEPQVSALVAEQVSQVNRTLLSRDVGDTLKRDISELQDHIEDIRALFAKVLGSLEDFDDQHLHADPTRSLAPDWKAFSNRFSEYVDNSRVSAAAASSLMNLYAEAVLGKVGEINCNVQELSAELTIFLRAVERQIPAAKGTRNDFKQLANDVRNFERKVECTLKHLNKPPSQDMSRVCDNIDVLKQKVVTIAEKPSTFGSGYFGWMASLAPRAAELLCVLSPRAAIQALQVVVEIGDSESDAPKREVQADLEQYAARIPALLESSHIPFEIRPFYEDWFANTGKDMRVIANRIDKISNIWDDLRLDLLALQLNLSLFAGHDNVANSAFLMEKISVSRTVLQRLNECLELYVRRIPQGKMVHGAA